MGFGTPSICRGEKHYGLETTTEDDFIVATVPAGERITIRSYLQFGGYRVISHCDVGVSVIPEPGTTLIANSGLRDNRCFIEVLSESSATDVGVASNYSVRAPECSAKR